ncbi:MAG: hypothetical protein K2Z81_04570, partial [Cyanobacteria bacterium]|nr:hypothetical protein [Cyanobacteriota bacterium]
NGKPYLDMENVRFQQHVSIQLFDENGKLLQRLGDEGAPFLVRDYQEVTGPKGDHFRTRSYPLSSASTAGTQPLSGFLQMQVSTRQRDVAIHNYLESVLFIAPALLVALCIAGSYFARWAVRPIDQALAALRQFLADSSHELGTPLAILRATSDNLSLDVVGMPDAEERVDTINRTTERMSKLVKDMTLLAKLETAELTREKKNLQLDKLVNESVSNFKELFQEKKLIVNCHTESAVIKGDNAAIEQLLINLFQNAIRYTDEGGTVTVKLAVQDGSACLTVSDTGIGIPAASLPHIFERFYRVDKARARADGGSGLGLAIVKATVESLEGTVSVTSEEGKGTKFTFSFPLVRG